jgi:hypothetical protein
LSGANTNITKNYPIPGQYNVWLEGDVDYITDFNLNTKPSVYGNVSNYLLPSASITFRMYLLGITGSITNFIFPPNVATVRFDQSNISGNTSNLVISASVVAFLINNTLASGSLPQIVAHATNAMNYNLSGCSFSDSNVTVFRKAMTIFNVGNQNVVFPTANIDKLLKALADWYQVNAPMTNCTFTLSGANMGIPTGGASNADITRLVGYYTTAGRTATVLVRTS